MIPDDKITFSVSKANLEKSQSPILIAVAIVLIFVVGWLWSQQYTTAAVSVKHAKDAADADRAKLASLCDDLRFIAQQLAVSNRNVAKRSGATGRPWFIQVEQPRSAEAYSFETHAFESCPKATQPVTKSRIKLPPPKGTRP